MKMKPFSLDHLSDVEFEEFCCDLLRQLGCKNLNWRKGTGLAGSTSDRGRDIECEFEREEVDGSRHTERWFVQCKHFKPGVPPEKLQGVLSWAQAERPHLVLIIASNFLSNPAKDYLKQYEATNKPPFRIRYWEKPDLERLTADKSRLLKKYNIVSEPSYLSILHPAHIFYLRYQAANTLDYLFKILDALEPGVRKEMLGMTQALIMMPRFKKPVTGKETLGELMIDKVDYLTFRERSYALAKQMSESLLVDAIVSDTLRYLLTIGDTTTVDEKIDLHNWCISSFEEEIVNKPHKAEVQENDRDVAKND
jgi:hypothetical protein